MSEEMVTKKWAIAYAGRQFKLGLIKGRQEVVDYVENGPHPFAWSFSVSVGKWWEEQKKKWEVK